ncbi:copper resistance protein B [Azomonas macrocytogenes]|uniref:Copper resistance protein B n=1 Tax=Azomonas macrocytogenes TaxID=69962 RepID=A0A839T464_AZOMA|nr:copper resistance protein B [Azomonas macrocytogenes]MBB3103276.1 copper resistance protein B [Azomonas macrocytogenes]
MNLSFSHKPLLGSAFALGLLGVAQVPVALAEDDHKHHSGRSSMGTHAGTGNAAHAMDHHGMTHDDGTATAQSRTPIAPITAADRRAAFPHVSGHTLHDSAIRRFFLFEKLEYQDADDGSALNWDAQGWIGGDVDRLVLRSQGERSNGLTEQAEIHAMWGHALNNNWDLVGGVRHDFKPESAQTWAALGAQGTFYNIDIEATGYYGENGQTSARFEATYDLLLTNRLILQPTTEINVYGRNDESRGVGAGLSEIEAGLRLRYEFVRQFAPYIGVNWSRSYDGTANMLREEGEAVEEWRFVAGIRLWF